MHAWLVDRYDTLSGMSMSRFMRESISLKLVKSWVFQTILID